MQARKWLFLFIKLHTSLHFFRQPYRQKFGLLISFGNFGRLKIPAIAFNRQELAPLQHSSPEPSMKRVSSGRKSIPSKLIKRLFLQILPQKAKKEPSDRRSVVTVKFLPQEK
jgi:hypothetical protein